MNCEPQINPYIFPPEEDVKSRIDNIYAERERREKVAVEIAGLQQRIGQLQKSVGIEPANVGRRLPPLVLTDDDKQKLRERAESEKSECFNAVNNLQAKEGESSIVERTYRDIMFNSGTTHARTVAVKDSGCLLLTEVNQNDDMCGSKDPATVDQYFLVESLGAALKVSYAADDLADIRQFDLNKAQLLNDEYWHLIKDKLEKVAMEMEIDSIRDMALEILDSEGKDVSKYEDELITVAEVVVGEGSTIKLVSESDVYDGKNVLRNISVVSAVQGDVSRITLDVCRGEFHGRKNIFKQNLQIMKALMSQKKD